MNFFRTTSLFVLAVLLPPAHAEDEDAVTPYRPSVSTPAQLPARGQLEFELGGLSAKSGDARRDSLPYTFKLAFSDEWGVLLGGEGYVSARDDSGQRARGPGDTTLVLKRAFLIDSATAFGIEAGAKMPTAKDSIGSGKSDYTVNGIFSRDIEQVHMDLNLNLTRLGARDPGTSRSQTGAAASFSTPVSERWGVIAELSGTRQRGAAGTAQLLLAATYAPNKRLAIDVGAARGLTVASPDWSVFTGIVVPLAKLW
jgi:hypothetical protein